MIADYVIVGAGSAGCAMAYRLAEAGRRVVVIEHGGSDAGPFIQMPGALSYPMNMGIYDWGFQTEPEPHLGGRRAGHPARQGDRRVQQHQRHGLCPRPRPRL
jgi:choline dehydrogenase